MTLVSFLFITPSYAYLDPGSVSIAIQSVLASIAGLAASYKLWFFRLKKFFSFKKNSFVDDKKNSSKN